MIAKILTILLLFALGIKIEAQTPKLEIEIIHEELLPISKTIFSPSLKKYFNTNVIE